MNELITKTVAEEFDVVCSLCGAKITGDTKNGLVFNLAKHKGSKECFEQRVQNELPDRTPNYKLLLSAKQESLQEEESK